MGGRTDTTVWTAPPTAGTADSQLMSGTFSERERGSKQANFQEVSVHRTVTATAGPVQVRAHPCCSRPTCAGLRRVSHPRWGVAMQTKWQGARPATVRVEGS